MKVTLRIHSIPTCSENLSHTLLRRTGPEVLLGLCRLGGQALNLKIYLPECFRLVSDGQQLVSELPPLGQTSQKAFDLHPRNSLLCIDHTKLCNGVWDLGRVRFKFGSFKGGL